MRAWLQCSDRCAQRCQQFGPEACCQGCPPRVRELCRRFQLCRQGECWCSDPDTLLMAAFADGEEDAFHWLYLRNKAWAERLAFRFTCHWQDAQEVVQEAFLRVIAFRHQWKALARFQTWFHRIVVNLCKKQQRQRQDIVSIEPFVVPEEETVEGLPERLIFTETPETVLLAQEAAKCLQDALDRLPPRQRQVLDLWEQGCSYRQIAKAMGLSLSAVTALLHRARATLRKLLTCPHPNCARKRRRRGLKGWR